MVWIEPHNSCVEPGRVGMLFSFLLVSLGDCQHGITIRSLVGKSLAVFISTLEEIQEFLLMSQRLQDDAQNMPGIHRIVAS